MKIRYARPQDDAAIREMHGRMGFDYELPDLQKMTSKLVFEDDHGKVRMAIYLRPTFEAYMFIDRSEIFVSKALQAKEQWSRFLCLHRASLKDALAKGVDDVYCFLPPELERSFSRRLKRLGWFRPWTAFCRILRPFAGKGKEEK
jgi:hypothetical protein